MPLTEVLAALTARDRKPKRSGAGHVALCPAHDDGRNPSLSIREGDDGRVLLKCHGAECPVENITAALGLTPSDLFESRPMSDNIAATYDYTDEDGVLLYQNVRLVPKDFRWRRPVSPSKGTVSDWIWTLDDVRRVPYRLPSVLTAARSGRAVWLVEGEKDVEALEALGFTATSSKNWLDEFTEYVKGAAYALIVADADQARPDKPNEKRGRETAEAVASKIAQAGIRVKVIDLDPTRDDGYDVSDFILQHGAEARARLEELARNARSTLAGPKLPIVTYGEFLQDVPEPDPELNYLGEFLRGGERVHVIGPIGQGKTTFMAEAMSAAVQGREFLGLQGKGGLRALYVELGDMPKHKTRRTLESARFNPDGNELALAYLSEGLKIDKSARDREMIESAFASYDIIAIDPWYKLLGVEVGQVMDHVSTITTFLDGLRSRYPRVAVMIGFHANEPQRGMKVGRLGDASGYKVFQRSVDIAVTFERIKANRSRVTFAKSRAEDERMQFGSEWLVEWTRGQGFREVKPQRATDRLYEAVPKGEPLDKWAIAEAAGMSAAQAARVANDLVSDGRASASGSMGGRGQVQRWTFVLPGQERLDVAA